MESSRWCVHLIDEQKPEMRIGGVAAAVGVKGKYQETSFHLIKIVINTRLRPAKAVQGKSRSKLSISKMTQWKLRDVLRHKRSEKLLKEGFPNSGLNFHLPTSTHEN